MLPSFFTQSIKIVRPSEKTERGSTVFDWTHTVETECNQCSVQPAGMRLDQDGRVLGIMDGLTIYCPYDLDVRAGDRIIYEGEAYTINGVPQPSISPSGTISTIQLQVRRWEG